MRLAKWGCAIAVAVGTAGMAGVGTESAQAQSSRRDENRYRPPPRAPARIVVTPSRRLVRKCVDWYQIEHRLAGTVVTPQMRCRWGYR
ncbi:MAG: hypothetical protein WB822_13810 [Rhodoplanes sp.]|jgi:hypothetical protein